MAPICPSAAAKPQRSLSGQGLAEVHASSSSVQKPKAASRSERERLGNRGAWRPRSSRRGCSCRGSSPGGRSRPSKPWNAPSPVRKHVVVTNVERFAVAASRTEPAVVVSRRMERSAACEPPGPEVARGVLGCRPRVGEAGGVPVPITVFSCPLAARHPQRSGVRFGECQLSRKVNAPHAGRDVARQQSEPTALEVPVTGKAHRRQRNRPKRTGDRPTSARRAYLLPGNLAVGGIEERHAKDRPAGRQVSEGLYQQPSTPSAARCRLVRPFAPTGLSSVNAMAHARRFGCGIGNRCSEARPPASRGVGGPAE